MIIPVIGHSEFAAIFFPAALHWMTVEYLLPPITITLKWTQETTRWAFSVLDGKNAQLHIY